MLTKAIIREKLRLHGTSIGLIVRWRAKGVRFFSEIVMDDGVLRFI